MKILLFSSLYPSSVRPIHGIFVETRLRELLKTGEVQAKVVAPVPWFPSTAKRFGEYAQFAATPRFEKRNGIDVFHPRYALLPKVGMNIAPYTMALGALATIKRLQREGFDFDLIDAHYYYPDGVAAGLLAKWLGKPFVVTARGTDLNLIPQHPFPRKLILQTAARASASVGVAQALMDTLRDLGADPAKLHTLRNGVDLERFTPEPREAARQRLGLPMEARYLLSVGHLIERKGHHIAIEALAQLPAVTLLIAGSGPEEGARGRPGSLGWRGAAGRLEVVVQRGRRAHPVQQSRRLGQCAPGSHGLRNPRDCQQHLGHARGGERAGRWPAHARARCWFFGRSLADIGYKNTRTRGYSPTRRSVLLGRHHPGATAAFQPGDPCESLALCGAPQPAPPGRSRSVSFCSPWPCCFSVRPTAAPFTGAIHRAMRSTACS